MRVLFDQGTPVPLRRALGGHMVATAYEMGWSEMTNGALLAAAESRFDVLVTTDQNLAYQQNLQGRTLAVVVLPTTSWPVIRDSAAEVAAAIADAQPVDFIELAFSR